MLAAASSSRIIAPGTAYLIIVAGAFAGPLLAGTAVAQTIGQGIVNYRVAGEVTLLSGLLGGIFALLVAYALSVPVSASVALVSATIGALTANGELGLLHWAGVAKVGISLVGSIVVGFAAGAVIYTALVVVLRKASMRTGRRIMRFQYASVAAQAIGYGANDAEKMMGLIAAATTFSSSASTFAVPLWVVAVSVAAFAVGMALGGMRIAKTVGGKLFHIRPLHALSFQIAAAGTVLAAAAAGGPLSTTETTASAILGVGAAANPRAVHWIVARRLVLAWFLTVPIGLAGGSAATLLFRTLSHGAR
jgi:PiT family inorganic phosphate transporter